MCALVVNLQDLFFGLSLLSSPSVEEHSRLSFPNPKAEACKSIDYAMKKCPNGMFSEIKYDGERVQVHKNGDHFSYFSRSLKPVLPHKVRSLHFYQDCLSLLPQGSSSTAIPALVYNRFVLYLLNEFIYSFIFGLF